MARRTTAGSTSSASGPAGGVGRPGAVDDGLVALTLALLRALAYRVKGILPERYANPGMTFCGLVVLFTPLLLWVAWSRIGYFAVMGIALAALIGFMVLAWLGPGDHL